MTAAQFRDLKAATLERCEVVPSGAAMRVTAWASSGACGSIEVAARSDVVAQIERLADAWVDIPLLATERRWAEFGRRLSASTVGMAAYSILDLACVVAACKGAGVSLSTVIAGVSTSAPATAAIGAGAEGAQPGEILDIRRVGGFEAIAKLALSSDATTIATTLTTCGGIAGLHRISGLARALGLQVLLSPETSDAEATSMVAELAAAFGFSVPHGTMSGTARKVLPTPLSIARIRLRRIVIGLTQPYISNMYLTDRVQRTIIEVETSDGIVGIGETGGSDEIFRLTERIAKGLVDQSAAARRKAAANFGGTSYANANGRSGWQALGGLDLACWDVIGKRMGAPLADLLGRAGPAEAVETVCLLPAAVLDRLVPREEALGHFADIGNVERVVAYAKARQQRYGFGTFKYKSIGNNAAWDLAVMRGLRRALGNHARLRIDPNAGYSTATAAALCRELEPLGVEFYEDPADGIEALARIRTAGGAAPLSRPIASNMVLIGFDDFAPVVRRGAIDVLLADLFHWGGIGNYRDMVAAAECLGLEVALHSFYETGVATAANLHLALGLGLTTYANDQGHQDLVEDILEGTGLEIEHGRMRLPVGPGIGVALDEQQMRKLTTMDVTIGR